MGKCGLYASDREQWQVLVNAVIDPSLLVSATGLNNISSNFVYILPDTFLSLKCL